MQSAAIADISKRVLQERIREIEVETGHNEEDRLRIAQLESKM
jgi:hypothetical protein